MARGSGSGMKYWAYLAGKLAAGAGFLYLMWLMMNVWIPEPEAFLRYKVARFPQDLRWTTALLVFWLAATGLGYLIVWDQRRRCKTCLRRLRMPISKGSWSQGSIFSPPRTESICPYGHGTQNVPQVHLASSEKAAWVEHSDIWKELEEIERN